MCNGDGSIVCVCGGGGGQHYKPSVVGVDFEKQIGQKGGGVPKKMTNL